MKLVHRDLNGEFNMDGNSACVFTVENCNRFSKYLSELAAQSAGSDGSFVLSHNGKLLEPSKYLEVHSQFIPFELNQRSLLNKLYASLGKYAVGEDAYIKTQEIKSAVLKYTADIVLEYDSDLEFAEEINIADIFKSVSLKFADDFNDISEKLLRYMTLVRELDRDKCFVFVNLKSYIPGDRLALFYKSVLNHGFNVLLLENTIRKKSELEYNLIIDSDLCEISY